MPLPHGEFSAAITPLLQPPKLLPSSVLKKGGVLQYEKWHWFHLQEVGSAFESVKEIAENCFLPLNLTTLGKTLLLD